MISCFVVRGHSMAPSLRCGDFVVASRLRGEPRPGDVIVYRERTKGFLVVHRVGVVRSQGLITKGDANPTADLLPVSREQVLGKVCWTSQRLGRLVTLLRRGRSL